jgi:hypothetical protein
MKLVCSSQFITTCFPIFQLSCAPLKVCILSSTSLEAVSHTMSGTLISSLVWVPRGKASLVPKKYTLDEDEIQRVGKLGGEGVLEQLRAEMEGMEMEEGEGQWEE